MLHEVVIALHYSQVTSNGTDWLPYSPDLKPSDFFLQRHLKHIVYSKSVICEACVSISVQTLQQRISNFTLRLHHVSTTHGSHIEYIVISTTTVDFYLPSKKISPTCVRNAFQCVIGRYWTHSLTDWLSVTLRRQFAPSNGWSRTVTFIRKLSITYPPSLIIFRRKTPSLSRPVFKIGFLLLQDNVSRYTVISQPCEVSSVPK
ncbi:hypothetical protein CEXT_694821 [Caerostris extrusa]|uniref:Maturase K n=1 Tax=Caerostris extrusa TaxID=172846 RepID=A0AAV4QCQ2_CAEEX|nr:hypothetical protein CEXT_694821 [Caerostris extrusa]